MARDSNGNYSLPAGNPVVPNTPIESSWANTTLNDLATAMTDSLSRSGNGGMAAPLKATDGTQALPSYTFTSQLSCGLYFNTTNDVRMSIAGVQTMRWIVDDVQVWDITDSVWRSVVLEGEDFTNLTVTGTLTAGNIVTASTEYVNPSAALGTSIVGAIDAANRLGLDIYSDAVGQANGAWMRLTSTLDTEPNEVHIGALQTSIGQNTGDADYVFTANSLNSMQELRLYNTAQPSRYGTLYNQDNATVNSIILAAEGTGGTPRIQLTHDDDSLRFLNSGTATMQLQGGQTTVWGDSFFYGDILSRYEIQFANNANVALYSTASCPNGADQQALELTGGTTKANGGWIDLVGAGSATDPNTVSIGTVSTDPFIVVDSTEASVRTDVGTNVQRIQWLSITTSFPSGVSLDEASANNVVFLLGNTTWTIEANSLALGRWIKLSTIGFTLTLIQGAGATLTWASDGPSVTGTRTITDSFATLECVRSGVYVLHGSGIS